MTGVASAVQKQVYGSAAIYNDANEHGGINGRKIELVIEDDGCNPGKGIAAVKKLLYQDKVFLLHGAWCSSVALAIKHELAKTPEVPYVVLGAVSSAISSPVQSNIFHPIPTTSVAGRQMADFALSKPGAKKIAIIRHSDEWGTVYSKAAIDRLKENGMDPVITANFERGETDPTSQVLSIKAAAPDVVLVFLYPAEFTIFLREAYKYKIKTVITGSTATSIDDAARMVGNPGAMKDVYCAWPLAGSLASPELEKFAKIFSKYYPSEILDMNAFYSMSGAIAIVEVLKRLGPDVNRERFIAQLDKLKNFDTGVQSAPMSFSPDNHQGIQAIKMIGLVEQKQVLFDKYPANAQ